MARYIDADAVDFSPLKNDFDRARAKVIIMGQPTADVVEVVRCAKCKHWKKTGTDIILNINYGKCTNCESPCHNEETTGGNYCSYGERKDNK